MNHFDDLDDAATDHVHDGSDFCQISNSLNVLQSTVWAKYFGTRVQSWARGNIWIAVFQMNASFLYQRPEKCHLCAFKSRIVGHPSHSQTQLSTRPRCTTMPLYQLLLSFQPPPPPRKSLLLSKWSHFNGCFKWYFFSLKSAVVELRSTFDHFPWEVSNSNG